MLALLSADSSLKALLSPSKKRARSIARGVWRNQLLGVLFAAYFTDFPMEGGRCRRRCRITRSANPPYATSSQICGRKKAARGDFDCHVFFALLVEVGGIIGILIWVGGGVGLRVPLIRPTRHPHKSVDVKKAAQGDFDYHVTSALLVEVSGS